MDYKKADMMTLCSLLGASTSTVRRDLDKLEADGFLKRVHGGAVLVEHDEPSSMEYIDDGYIPVASLAVHFVKNDDIIFLGGGNQCLCIAKALVKNNWIGSIVTNNLNAACEAAASPLIHVTMLGGMVINANGRLTADGDETVQAMRNVVVNKAFVTATGYSLEYGVFVDSSQQAALYQTLEKHSMETYLVMADKYDRIGRVRLGGPDHFKRIISLPSIPDAIKRYCSEQGIALYTSYLDDPAF